MKRSSVGTVLWVGCLVWIATGCGGLSEAVAEAPQTRPAATAPASVDQLCDAGIGQVLDGKLDDGLAMLTRAARRDPKHATAATALRLVRAHMTHRARFAKERAAQFQRAADRVRRSVLTEAYAATDDGGKRHLALRDKVRGPKTDASEDEPDGEPDAEPTPKKPNVISAYNRIATGESLLAAETDKKAAELKKESLQAVGEAAAILTEAVKVLDGDKSEFAKVFRELAGRLDGELKKVGGVWASLKTGDPGGRRPGARALKALEDDLSDALSDVDAMVAEKPWRLAMMQARLAREIASDSDALKQHDWFRKLVDRIVVHAKAASKSAKWYEALSAYAGLKELDPGNEEFENRLKAVRRNVRAMGLYGPAKGADGSDDGEPRWKRISRAVDFDMARSAIAKIDSQYVKNVDYRKVAYGALRSIRALAETPEVAKTFAGLADAEKKEKFLRVVSGEVAGIIKKDRVDHTDLTRTLWGLIRASEETVQIPVSVLALEFTDGALDELDRFSSMVWPDDVDDFRKATMGEFSGVGIQITKQPGQPLKVATPLANSPAYRAGIKSGDRIVAVQSSPEAKMRRTEDLSIDKLVRMITGTKGTKVILRIKRNGLPKPIDFEIIRAEIRIRTVTGWRRVPGGDGGRWDYLVDPENKIAYVRVTQFTGETPSHLAGVLEGLRAQGVRSLILDLRFNPGGLLGAAQKVADEFLTEGKIVSTIDRPKRERALRAGKEGNYVKGDLIVLANEMSASASEIVAGAIHDLARGRILGKRTFGKGSVQHVIKIPRHDAYLKLTTAYYYLPSGRCLHRINGAKSWGVEPDVAVHITPRQRMRLTDLQHKANLLHEVDPKELARDLAEEYDADLQLRTAVLFMRLMQLREKTAA